MRSLLEDPKAPLPERVEDSIRQSTHGRVRDLTVEEVEGRFVVRGRVPNYHLKQMALSGTMALLPSDRFEMDILVS